jgi:hypothetical protein
MSAAVVRRGGTQDSDSLAGAVAHAARRAGLATLVLSVITGIALAAATVVVSGHRVLLIAASLSTIGFGAGGLAARGVLRLRQWDPPDPVLVRALTAIEWVSAVTGTCAAIAGGLWVFFRVLGSSFWQ